MHFTEHFKAPTGNSLEALLHFPLRFIAVAGMKSTDALNLAERPFPKQSKVCNLPKLFSPIVIGNSGLLFSELLEIIQPSGLTSSVAQSPIPASLMPLNSTVTLVGLTLEIAYSPLTIGRPRSIFTWTASDQGLQIPEKFITLISSPY